MKGPWRHSKDSGPNREGLLVFSQQPAKFERMLGWGQVPIKGSSPLDVGGGAVLSGGYAQRSGPRVSVGNSQLVLGRCRL